MSLSYTYKTVMSISVVDNSYGEEGGVAKSFVHVIDIVGGKAAVPVRAAIFKYSSSSGS